MYNGNSHNNEGDAFRHALWSYLSTLDVGYEEAKNFLDAHEITSTNSDNERMMDLFNNEIGRRLALDPRNTERDPVEVIMEAIQADMLRITPFNAPSDPPKDYYK
ncbi:DUF6973 domain-containing protein [Curvivirga aplysinae]|uniref:DUF6973 domain-containing protein n=1 Tax=Curvivirga aplysinae TaxID=2529852 RepID=UPI0012BBF387|nr:hypothetical protein [Curvivirga aplysinae]MTI09097.1 hypothetical protein [Curvivirga aplysinae]